jgi:predicted AAA+ superfamily ATPase
VYPSSKPGEIKHIEIMRQIPGRKVIILGKRGTGKSSIVNRPFNEQKRQSKGGSACEDRPEEVLALKS